MIWAKEETMSRAEIEAIQLKRLKETVRRVYEKVEPYRRKMEEAGIKPEDIRTLKDLEKLPFTTKQDMRDNYPYGLFAVPLKKLRRIHASSGTTGKPTVVGYTEQDLEVWKECVARLAAAAGGTEDDIAQICFGYGMFTGALGLHCGLEKLGAAIIPSSTGNTQKQLMYMKDFGATLLVATPSYAMRIAEVAKEIGIDPKKDLKVKTLVLGSELMTEAMRKELHKVWGEDAKITQNYGMSELMGPGVSGECQELNGMHINEDHFIAEVIDPKTGQVLPDGEAGELVITTLRKEGAPLIRYRTHDLTRFLPGECACGRAYPRIDTLIGRTDDMVKVKGVNIFPGQIDELLRDIEGASSEYQVMIDHLNGKDIMTLFFETDAAGDREPLETNVRQHFKTKIGITIVPRAVSIGELPRSEKKSTRIFDNRY